MWNLYFKEGIIEVFWLLVKVYDIGFLYSFSFKNTVLYFTVKRIIFKKMANESWLNGEGV